MSNSTGRLGLFKWDTTNATDLESQFNIDKSMNENLDKIDGAVGDLQDKSEENATNIEANTTEIANNKTKINKNTADITTNKNNIAKNKTDTAKNATDISSIKTKVDDLETDNTKNKSDIARAKSDISTLQTDKADKSEIPTQISDLNNDADFLTEDEVNQLYIDINDVKKSLYDAEMIEATPTDNESEWGGYYTKDGEFQESTDKFHKTYLIKGLETISVKNYAGGNLPLALFYNGSNLLEVYIPATGWTNSYIDLEVPSGATRVIVNGSDSVANISVKTLVYNTSTDYKKNVLESVLKLEANTTSLQNKTNLMFHSLYEENYVEIQDLADDNLGTYSSNGTISNASISGRFHRLFDVSDVESVRVISYLPTNNTSFPIVVWFDESMAVISCEYSQYDWQLKAQDFNVPVGGCYAGVNTCDKLEYITFHVYKYDTSYKVREHIEALENKQLNTNLYDYEIACLNQRLTKNEKMNDFEYSAFDKSYFVITIDDVNKYLPAMYDLCHELNIPLSPAIITSNLNVVHPTANNRSVKDICDLVVEDGGEILAHSAKFIVDSSIEEDYIDVFRKPKQTLEELGYNVRGIITAGGENYLQNDIRLDNWSRKYYDYSDRNGLMTSKAYWHPRWWIGDYQMEGAKSYIDKAITDKSFVVMAMHGSDNSSSMDYIDNIRELLEYMIAKGSDKLEITTWANVYDRFKSSKLEERIKQLEAR